MAVQIERGMPLTSSVQMPEMLPPSPEGTARPPQPPPGPRCQHAVMLFPLHFLSYSLLFSELIHGPVMGTSQTGTGLQIMLPKRTF